ncbi:hypothetical protein [Zoogloea sp. 1C4]|uniref:hypothetical protein n=1 Tax=Zoogloea sp. 1C4 TaxID=2570190 RepID=UPI001290D02C|nr:hypothetical protein [Zoogloea sp. 1C4]
MKKEADFQNKELLGRSAFSAEEFASFRLPGLPGTSRAWRDLLKAVEWPSRAVRSRGRGGLKHEYEPPAELLELIRRHLNGEEVARDEVIAAKTAGRRPMLLQGQANGTLDENGDYVQRVQQLSALHDIGKASAQFQAAIARGTVKVGTTSEASDAELLVALGIALTKATWLPSDTPPEQRMAIARAASRAICAITDSPANRTRIALNSDILDDALSLAWLVDPNRSK